MIEITQAVSPSDVFFNNLHISEKKRNRRSYQGYIFILLLLGIFMVITYGLGFLQDYMHSD